MQFHLGFSLFFLIINPAHGGFIGDWILSIVPVNELLVPCCSLCGPRFVFLISRCIGPNEDHKSFVFAGATFIKEPMIKRSDPAESCCAYCGLKEGSYFWNSDSCSEKNTFSTTQILTTPTTSTKTVTFPSTTTPISTTTYTSQLPPDTVFPTVTSPPFRVPTTKIVVIDDF